MKNSFLVQSNKILWALPFFIYSFFALKDLSLPGLYMDSVNPDYLASWIIRGEKSIPLWAYPDNLLAGAYKFPILNSLYGGNPTAYIGLIFFLLFGFGYVQVHIYHALLGLILLAALFWVMKKWGMSNIAIVTSLTLLALDPNFIFAWRTQYYLQLFPFIFFALGLGFLGLYLERLITTKISHVKYLLISGLLFGFAAYSYFIFFLYGFVALVFYSFNDKLISKNALKHLFFGFILGSAPYIYAHISIIFNINLSEYMKMLKDLEDTYGVFDNRQDTIISRTFVVGDRLTSFFAGKAIESVIFGSSDVHVARTMASCLIYIFGIVTTLISLFIYEIYPQKKSIAKEHCSLSLVLLIIFFTHIIFGFLIGRPLGFQHYIMLLPIIYLLIAIGLNNINKIISLNLALSYLFAGVFLLCSIFNFTLSNELSSRLKKEGGNAMYSDVINVVAEYIKTLPPDTVLLFPQWGYWMGVITAVGPKFDVIEALSLNELQVRIVNNRKILDRNSFALFIDEKISTSSDLNNDENIKNFLNSLGLEIFDEIQFSGRNQKDKLSLILIQKQLN